MIEYSECHTLGAVDCPSCRIWQVLHVMGQEGSGGMGYYLVYPSTLTLHAGFKAVAGPYHLPKDIFVCCNLIELESV